VQNKSVHTRKVCAVSMFILLTEERRVLPVKRSIIKYTSHVSPNKCQINTFMLVFQPTHTFTSVYNNVDRLYGLVVRVPGFRKEMYCVSCEVRTELIYVM
jgi:hypothetical protein